MRLKDNRINKFVAVGNPIKITTEKNDILEDVRDDAYPDNSSSMIDLNMAEEQFYNKQIRITMCNGYELIIDSKEETKKLENAIQKIMKGG